MAKSNGMRPESGRLPDPIREVFIVKRWVQIGVYLAVTLPLPLYYYFLALNTLQLGVWYGVGLVIATVAIEGTFWYMIKLRKQSAYPNILAVELGTAQDLKQACDLSTRIVAEWLDAPTAVLAWVDEEKRAIPMCSYGLPAPPLDGGAFDLGSTAFAPTIADGRAVLLRAEELPEWSGTLGRRCWVAAVPLSALDRVTAVLFLITDRRSRDMRDRKLLESMGMVIGLTLENLRLTGREYQSIMQVLCSALDMRDSATEGHSQRVARMAALVAERMGQSRSEIKWIERAAALHDIGKIGVSDAVLSKAGPLTDDEWVEMRRHPRLGYEIVADIETMQHAAEIVHCHHERYDGRGYPRGLKGEEIPIGARIFAVVDSYDAMTSHRPYRRARPHEGAIEEIVRCSGTQFEPAAVKAFLEVAHAGLIVPHDSPDAGSHPALDARPLTASGAAMARSARPYATLPGTPSRPSGSDPAGRDGPNDQRPG